MGKIRGGLLSAADPSGPARSPPKIPPSGTPPVRVRVRRKSGGSGGVRLGGILGGLRAGPLGSAADKSPPRIMPSQSSEGRSQPAAAKISSAT